MFQVNEDVLPSKAKALVFDMDGTILDSNDHHTSSWLKACQNHKLNIDKEKYMEQTGKAGKDIVTTLCKEQGVELSEDEVAQLVKEESEIFNKEGLPDTKLIPEVMAIIKEGQKRGLPLAVCSGGQQDTVKKTLKKFGIEDVFKVVVTSHDVEHAKPEPDIFIAAAERLGVKPEECVAYEDAIMGLESANKAGYLKVVDVTCFEGHPQKDDPAARDNK